MSAIAVHKTSAELAPDWERVITRRFMPADESKEEGRARIARIMGRVQAMPDAEVRVALERLEARFSSRHKDLRGQFLSHFASVAAHLKNASDMIPERILLIGGYFTHEYAIEAAALCNPSMVAAPDQSHLPAGATRFILSLRAIGEGHRSCIEFRSGVVHPSGDVTLHPSGRFVTTAHHRAPIYDRDVFRDKLTELRAYGERAHEILSRLADSFTLTNLEEAIQQVAQEGDPSVDESHIGRTIHWLATSNYESTFEPETPLCERVLFPSSPHESGGMEDARFVRFTREDGTVTYFATYTAYDGYQTLPQLIETEDFLRFRIASLNGPAAKNKGIALFPRKVGGRYVALGRLDNENNFLLRSDNVRFWYESELLQAPGVPWEFIQLGNCGSPLETDAGWLVITHGVGPMRQYSLGAILLDRDDPSKVLGHLEEPLLEAAPDEREGYVPNVVYSCGSMIVGDHLLLPYGFSDVGTRIARIQLSDLLNRMSAQCAPF
jgi:predicted GH43/DUF377 family glycosyl hydrolase